MKLSKRNKLNAAKLVKSFTTIIISISNSSNKTRNSTNLLSFPRTLAWVRQDPNDRTVAGDSWNTEAVVFVVEEVVVTKEAVVVVIEVDAAGADAAAAVVFRIATMPVTRGACRVLTIP